MIQRDPSGPQDDVGDYGPRPGRRGFGFVLAALIERVQHLEQRVAHLETGRAALDRRFERLRARVAKDLDGDR